MSKRRSYQYQYQYKYQIKCVLVEKTGFGLRDSLGCGELGIAGKFDFLLYCCCGLAQWCVCVCVCVCVL